MKQWHFYDKVYRRWVVLIIGSLEDFRKELEDCKFDDMDSIYEAKGMVVELTNSNNTTGQRCNMLWLNGYETATLIHEIVHLVMYQFEEVGVPISKENGESFAFYTEYWFSEVQKARRKFPDGRKSSEITK